MVMLISEIDHVCVPPTSCFFCQYGGFFVSLLLYVEKVFCGRRLDLRELRFYCMVCGLDWLMQLSFVLL